MLQPQPNIQLPGQIGNLAPQQPTLNLNVPAPVVVGIAPVAPAQQPQVREDPATIIQRHKNSNQRLTQEDQLKDLRSKVELLQNRIQKDFTSKYNIPRSKEQMNNEVSKTLISNLTKMGVSIKHIYYMNDMLKALNDKIRSDKENRANFTVQSFMKIADLNCVTRERLLNMHREAVLNSTSYKEHELSRVQHNSMNRLFEARRQIQVQQESSILQRHHDYDYFYDRNDQIVQGMFEKARLDLLFMEYNKQSQNDCVQKIFEALAQSSRVLTKEFKLLSIQFKDYSPSLQLIEVRQLIINNTIKYLEEEFRQNFNQFDLMTLSRHFYQIYFSQGQMSKYRIFQTNGVYPSGVLFLLSRMGRLDLAKKVFENWNPSNQIMGASIAEFIKIQENWELQNSEIKFIYERTLSSSSQNIDPILKQLYLIKFSISEIEDLFEQVQFNKDKDLLLWLTLKTCTADEDPDSEYLRLTLNELQQTIPPQGKNQYMLDLQLQCYERALITMGESLKNYPQELALLMIILKDCGLISEDCFNHLENQTQAVTQVCTLLFSNKPLLAGAILKRKIIRYDRNLGDEEILDFIHTLSKLFVKHKQVQSIIFDEKFRYSFKDQVLSFPGEGSQINNLEKLVEFTVKEYFKEQLHTYFKQFQEILEKSTNLKQVVQSTQGLYQNLDSLIPYASVIYYFRTRDSLALSTVLVNEVYYVKLFADTLQLQSIVQNFSKPFTDPEVTKIFQGLKYPETKDLNHIMKMVAQDIQNEGLLQYSNEIARALDSLQIVEYFNQVIDFVKRDRKSPKDFTLAYDLLLSLRLHDKVVPLKYLCKEEMIFNLLWVIQNLFTSCQKDVEFIQTIIRDIKQHLNRASQQERWVEVSKQRVLEQELEITQKKFMKMHQELKQQLLHKNSIRF